MNYGVGQHTVWHQIFAGVYFGGLAIFCVLRELIFAIKTNYFFLSFAIIRKYAVPSIDNVFVVVEYVQQKYIFKKQYYGMGTLCKTTNSLYTVLFLSERGNCIFVQRI